MSDYKKKVIVDSMSIKEILLLLNEDMRFLKHKIDENMKKYRRITMKSNCKERVFYNPLNYKSAAGFNYVIQFFKRAYNENEKDKLGVLYYIWFMKSEETYNGNKRGVYAVTFSRLSLRNEWTWHFTIYKPHFMDRYKERFLKDNSISKIEAFHRYYLNNLKVTSSGRPSEKYPKGYWMVCNEGICLCNRLEGFTVEVATFVDFETAGFHKKQFALEAKEAVLDIGFELKLPEEDFDEFEEEFN